MLDLDSTETQNEDSPRLETTATQPQYRLPHEFKARAPRFFADNNNEDVPTPNICPWPCPCPIPARQQVQAVLVLSSAHISRYDHSGSEIADMLPPEHNEMDVEGVTTVVVSTEQNSEAQVP